MKKIKQATALAAAAALSATMLAGCGGSTESTASTATETASSASTAAESGNAGEFTYPMAAGHSITYWCNLNENIGSYYKDMGESPFGKGLMENTGVDITCIRQQAARTSSSTCWWPTVICPMLWNTTGRTTPAAPKRRSPMVLSSR